MNKHIWWREKSLGLTIGKSGIVVRVLKFWATIYWYQRPKDTGAIFKIEFEIGAWS